MKCGRRENVADSWCSFAERAGNESKIGA